MNVVLRIPDEIATRLSESGADLERQALEALVVESYRAARLSKDELARALGLDGGDQIDAFLKAHDVFEPGAVEDIHLDAATLAPYGS